MPRLLNSLVTSAIVCLAGAPAFAQWIQHPTPGLPRTADGKPNLTAPAPRAADGKPDLSGLWRLDTDANVTRLIQDAGVQGWATARREKYRHELGRDDPGVHCLPFGPRASMNYGFAAKIIQTPGLMVILYEDLTYRQIFLDGRQLPVDPNPSWMGYSIGRWDGDALVVTTAGYNDRSLLDFDGHPHSEALRVTERFRRRDFGHIDVQLTLEDPKVIGKPVTIPMHATIVPDTELLEYVCQENERSRQRLVGTLDDDRKYKVPVAAAVLARYAGTYSVPTPEGPRRVRVVAGDGELTLEVQGGSTITAIPVSETRFMAEGVGIEFFPGPGGVVSDIVVTIVEGDLKGTRVSDK